MGKHSYILQSIFIDRLFPFFVFSNHDEASSYHFFIISFLIISSEILNSKRTEGRRGEKKENLLAFLTIRNEEPAP